MTIENNYHSDPSIKSDMGQHLQFLRCFSFICYHLSCSGPASGQHQLCPSAEPRGQHTLGRRQVGCLAHILATKPSSSTGIKQLQRAFTNKLYRIYRNICIYRALYNVSREIYRSEKECPNNLSLIQKHWQLSNRHIISNWWMRAQPAAASRCRHVPGSVWGGQSIWILVIHAYSAIDGWERPGLMSP